MGLRNMILYYIPFEMLIQSVIAYTVITRCSPVLLRRAFIYLSAASLYTSGWITLSYFRDTSLKSAGEALPQTREDSSAMPANRTDH